MIAVAVLARRGDEYGETVEEFERGEFDDGAPITVGFGEALAHRWDGACSGFIARVVVPDQAPACKWRPGAVPKEALEACAVAPADAHARVEREASRVIPGAHLLDGVPREQAFALEQAQHPGSGDGLNGGDVAVGQRAGTMKAKRDVGVLAEHAVDGAHMDMGVGIERRAKSLDEADRAEACVSGRAR